jgi:hypothetical protein
VISGSAFAEMEVAGGETLENLIKGNSGILLLYSFISCTILIQLLIWIFNIKNSEDHCMNRHFCLAMAFAGNDLVNFIGSRWQGSVRSKHGLQPVFQHRPKHFRWACWQTG